MRASLLCLLTLALSFSIACQQADGPMPEKNEEVTNRIDDLSRDIANVARGDRQAPGEFLDDLMLFGDASPAAEDVRALGQTLSSAVAGKRLSDEGAKQVAEQLWLVTAGRELSERQRQGVVDDLSEALSGAGLTSEAIEPVVTAATSVQAKSSTRPRRWYERF